MAHRVFRQIPQRPVRHHSSVKIAVQPGIGCRISRLLQILSDPRQQEQNKKAPGQQWISECDRNSLLPCLPLVRRKQKQHHDGKEPQRNQKPFRPGQRKSDHSHSDQQSSAPSRPIEQQTNPPHRQQQEKVARRFRHSRNGKSDNLRREHRQQYAPRRQLRRQKPFQKHIQQRNLSDKENSSAQNQRIQRIQSRDPRESPRAYNREDRQRRVHRLPEMSFRKQPGACRIHIPHIPVHILQQQHRQHRHRDCHKHRNSQQNPWRQASVQGSRPSVHLLFREASGQ